MKFNISGFTHIGTVRKSNQDHILVNGALLNDGEIHLSEQEYCTCFVADGVGGNNAGEFASSYVLNEISRLFDVNQNISKEQVNQINHDLITLSSNNIRLKGTATTLTGINIRSESFQVFHAGDSELWLLRNGIIFKVTNDQILDETEKNSPITSYFGGNENRLSFDENISIDSTQLYDIFLLCTDGLLKSLPLKMIKSILSADKELKTKVQKIMENCINLGAEDNVSIIVIQSTP